MINMWDDEEDKPVGLAIAVDYPLIMTIVSAAKHRRDDRQTQKEPSYMVTYPKTEQANSISKPAQVRRRTIKSYAGQISGQMVAEISMPRCAENKPKKRDLTNNRYMN